MKNSKSNIITKIIYFILILVFTCLFIFSMSKIIKWYKENKENTKIEEQIKSVVTVEENQEDEVKTIYNIDFEELKNKNNDTVAWLKVEGTNIEYPVVKAKDNDLYLTHNFNKKYNSAGWVFADCKNKFDGTDKNIVIFGHNRKDGSMFGSLKNILTKEWQDNEENHIIKLYTPESEKEYKVFSIYRVENEEYYIKTDFRDKEYSNFIKTVKNRSVKNFNVEVTENDNILTLSTCADNNKYRVVLHAKEIK